MKKFSKNAILLLLCLLTNGITSTFIYSYLLAFILDISNNGIVNVAIFYLVLHTTMIALSWILAPMFKKFNKSLALKIGIVFKFLFVLTIVFIGDTVVNFVYLIAICNALSEVLFWGGANPLQPIVTKNTSMSLYMSVTKILSTIIGFIVPVLMGFCIDKIGLHSIAIAMTIIVSIQLTLAMFINEKNEIDNTKLKYKEFIKKIKSSFSQAKHIYLNQFLYGFCSNVSMLILYYTVITFGSNVSIGIFSTVSSIISIVILAIYNIKRNIFHNYITSSIFGVSMISAITLVMLNLNRTSLIIFYTLWTITIIIPDIITGSSRLKITKQSFLKKYNIENITISETYLDFGRVVGEIMLLIMGLINNKVVDIVCLCVTAVLIAIYFTHSIYIKRKVIFKIPKDKEKNI